jgi:hypothetical protein
VHAAFQLIIEEEEPMALFMDVHTLDGGVAADAVAAAHQRDLEKQDEHGVSYLRYWVDEGAGKIFCLSRRRTHTPPTPFTAKRTAWWLRKSKGPGGLLRLTDRATDRAARYRSSFQEQN